jgi:biopolymer transport protein ExbD
VLLEDRSLSINELIAEIEREKLPAPFELHADGSAVWMQVQWVMAALGQAGHEAVRCVVRLDDGRGLRSLEVRLNRGLWEDRFPDYGYGLDENLEIRRSRLASVAVLTPESTQGSPAETVEFRFIEDLWNEADKARHPGAIGKWAASFLRRAESEKSFSVHFAVEAAGQVPYRHVVTAIAKLREVGIREVEVGLEALHPWDRNKRVLPSPPAEAFIPRWFLTDLSVHRFFPVNLPVAYQSEQDTDDDPDDRVIITLTSTGRLFVKTRELSLLDLSRELREAAEAYETKMNARGKVGFDEFGGQPWSKLFVLLRADQEAPWEHVRWVMAELHESAFYRLQFGARKRPGRDRSVEEAERRWAAWEIHGLFYTLEGKLQCFLPTGPSSAPTRYIDVELVGFPPRFRMEDRETGDPETLAQWIGSAYPRDLMGVRVLGRITAEPRARFGNAVRALNAFAMKGLQKVDFAGVELAPADVRRMARLPSPR